MVACLWQATAPVRICDFTATFDLGQPTISHHIAKLKAAGLIESEKRGIWVYYRLRDDLSPETSALLGTLLAGIQNPEQRKTRALPRVGRDAKPQSRGGMVSVDSEHLT
jgi:DNA-binding transcriptional ArsR family regulator